MKQQLRSFLYITLAAPLVFFSVSCDSLLDQDSNSQGQSDDDSQPVLQGSKNVVDAALAKENTVVIVDFYSNS